MRLQLELFGSCWVFVSEVSSILDQDEELEVVETYSSTGFQRNEEEDN